MNLPEGDHLAFSDFRAVWYAYPESALSVFTDAWSFEVAEVDLGEHGTAIQACIFSDAFTAFTQVPEFFASLAVNGLTQLDQVVVLLRSLGATDETTRTAPYPFEAAPVEKAAAVIRNHPGGTTDPKQSRRLAAAILDEIGANPG